MKDRIKKFLVEKTGCSIEQLKDDLELAELGIDSLNLLLIISDFEDEFNLTITDEELLKVITLNDLVLLAERN